MMTKRMLIFGMIALGITFAGKSKAAPGSVPSPTTLPQGLAVQGGGTAQIDYSGKQLTITPAQPHTLIHETSFNVGAGHNVHHVHASANYTTIHIVQTPTPSEIAGTISATSGNVVLVNPYGIAFTDGARIDVPGHFIASTHGMTGAAEATFLSTGRLIFDGPSHGDLLQSGNLTFSGMGLAFISPFIAQQGIIVGRAHALNTDKRTTITVDFMDRRFNFGLSAKQAGSVAKEVVDKEGDVVMTAGAVDEMLRHVSPSSRAVASGLQEGPGGALYLLADEKGGQVLLEGTIDLSSGAAGTKGSAGSLQVSGEQVHVTKSAQIFAKGLGEHHAGNLYFGVGADYTTLREQILKDAASANTYVGISNLRIDDGAVFDVSAQGIGSAGGVYFVSQKESLFGAAHVNISSAKGQGGLVDFSGLGHLRRFEQVNITSAIHGNPNVGTVLLDPAYIKIAPTFDAGTQTGITHLLTSWVKETLASGSNLTIATTHVPNMVPGHADDIIEINDLISWASGTTLSFVANKITFGTNGGINLEGEGTLNLRSHATKASANGSLIVGTGTTVIDLGQHGTLQTFSKGGVGVDPTIAIKRTGVLVDQGDGWVDHYSLVYDRDDLAVINTDNTTRAGKYALANDITIWSDEGDDPWAPIGFNNSDGGGDPLDTAFTGKFTGANYKGGAYKISGLVIQDNDPVGIKGTGLFGLTHGATISDLVVENPLVRQPNAGLWVGTIAGYMRGGSINRVHVTKTNNIAWDVEGGTAVGGLVGELSFQSIGKEKFPGIIANSSSQVNVRTLKPEGQRDSIGGLVGSARLGSSITDSFATGKVGDGNGSHVGGLIGLVLGSNDVNTTITRSYATGAVHGFKHTGGLIGSTNGTAENLRIENVYSTGNVRGGENTGALLGLFGTGTGGGTLSFAHSTGNVALDEGPMVVVPIPVGLIGNVFQFGDQEHITNVYYSGTSPEGINAFGELIGVKLEGDDVNDLEQYVNFDPEIWHTQSPPQLIPGQAPIITENNQVLGIIPAPQEDVEEGQGNNGMGDGDAEPDGGHDGDVLPGQDEPDEGEGAQGDDDGDDNAGDGDDDAGADADAENVAEDTPVVNTDDENQGETLTVTVNQLKALAGLEEDADYEMEERGLEPDAPHIMRATFKNANNETVKIKYNTQTGARQVSITDPDGKEEIYLYTPEGERLPLKKYTDKGEIEVYGYDKNYQLRAKTVISGTKPPKHYVWENGVWKPLEVKINFNTQTGARQVSITTPEGRERITLYPPNGKPLPIKRYIQQGSIEVVEEFTYDENYQPLTRKVTYGTNPPVNFEWKDGEWKPLNESLTTPVTVDNLKELVAKLDEDHEMEELGLNPNDDHIVRATFKNANNQVKIKYNTPTSTRQVSITTPEGREEIYLYTPNGKSLPIKRYNDKGEIEEYTYDENYQPLTRKVTYGTNSPVNFEWKDGGWKPLNGSSMESFAAAATADDDDSTATSRFSPLKDVTVGNLSGDDIKLGLEAIAAMPTAEQKAKIAEVLKDVDTKAAFKTIIETVHELVASGLNSNPAQVNALQNIIGLIVTSSSSSNPMIDFLQNSINNPQIMSNLGPFWGTISTTLISQSSAEARQQIVAVLNSLAQ